MSIKKLVFSGGGTKGIAYVGVLKYLEENNLLKHVDTIVGTSVGAVVALLIAIGYTSDQLFKIIENVNFNDLQNITTDSVLNIFNSFGLDDCTKIINLLTILVNKKMGKANPTILDVYNEKKIKLIITSTCIDTKKLEYFDYLSHPDIELLK